MTPSETIMPPNAATTALPRELAALAKLPVGKLRIKYAEVFGQPTRSGNRNWLLRKIAWRIQQRALGGLSERARARAAELADEADLRVVPPALGTATVTPEVPTTSSTGRRLPPAGTLLTREYRGQVHEVTVLAKGFAYGNQVYASLSAVANAITGSHVNGFRFFGLQ